jgi:hypothetical protein
MESHLAFVGMCRGAERRLEIIVPARTASWPSGLALTAVGRRGLPFFETRFCDIGVVESCIAIASTIRELIGQSWTDGSGNTRPLEVDDFMVVAPYNDQVASAQPPSPNHALTSVVKKCVPAGANLTRTV